MDRMKRSTTVVAISVVSLLLMLERVFLDFRYVALEMEPLDALMPFTAPYMVIAFLLFGGWIWALLAATQGSRGALMALIGFNLLNLVFGLSTVAFLCPTPCQTAWPITDLLVYAQLLTSAVAMLTAAAAWRGARALPPAQAA